MSQQNVEIVRRAFAAYERGDVAELSDLMVDDLVVHRPEPDNLTFHGKEGFYEATADWVEGFDDWKATPEEYVEAGETVLVQVHQAARGKGSGVPVESRLLVRLRSARRENRAPDLSHHQGCCPRGRRAVGVAGDKLGTPGA